MTGKPEVQREQNLSDRPPTSYGGTVRKKH